MAWKSTEQRQWRCVSRLWGRIKNLPDDRIVKTVFEWAHIHAMSGKKNWVYKCIHFFNENNCLHMFDIVEINMSLVF
jgi:hypothetical protein